MGNVLVVYDSKSGNTAKMACQVALGASAVEGIVVRVLESDEATADDFLWCDGVAVGTPTNMGIVSWKLKKFFDEVVGPTWGKLDGKLGCAFATQGGWGGGAELACMSVLQILMNFGFLVFGVTDYVGKQFTLHYGATIAGEPRTESEVAACQCLGRRLAEWVAVLHDGRSDLNPVAARTATE